MSAAERIAICDVGPRDGLQNESRSLEPSVRAELCNRLARAGLPRVGGHRLRHALASEMLRQGSDLVEISQVLRHRDLATTSVYAKVDRAALRTVARPWPGAAR